MNAKSLIPTVKRMTYIAVGYNCNGRNSKIRIYEDITYRLKYLNISRNNLPILIERLGMENE